MINIGKLKAFFHIGNSEDGDYLPIYDNGNISHEYYMNDSMIKTHNYHSSKLTTKSSLHSSMNVNYDDSQLSDTDSRTPDSSSMTSDTTDITNIDSKSPPLMGMILVTISAFCYAALNLSVKALMQETPWQELMIIRMGITWIATMIWILVQYKGQMSLWGPKDKRLLLVWRAFFLWGAMFCCWWSFEFLPVGDGTTLAMSFPVWVSIIAHFVFKNENDGISSGISQRLDIPGWICVFSGLIGIVFVAQPSFIFGGDSIYGPARDVGIVIGLCSAVCAGAQYVIVNYTKEDCHWLQIEQITAFLSTFILMPIGFIIFAGVKYYKSGIFDIGWVNLDFGRWCEEIGLGLLGFVALALLTRGSQLDAPARTAICLYLQIPFTYTGQSIMTKTIPNLWVFVGISLVLISVILPAIRKLQKAKQIKLELQKQKHEEHRQKKIAVKALIDHESDDDSNSNSKTSSSKTNSNNIHNSDDNDDNEDEPLLMKSETDITKIPKYTISVGSNSSFGGRNFGYPRGVRRYSKNNHYDYQSSSSGEEL